MKAASNWRRHESYRAGQVRASATASPRHVILKPKKRMPESQLVALQHMSKVVVDTGM
jgi:hypothetical protein